MARPSSWKHGKCGKGHDVTKPHSIYLYKKYKYCQTCKCINHKISYQKNREQCILRSKKYNEIHKEELKMVRNLIGRDPKNVEKTSQTLQEDIAEKALSAIGKDMG